MQELRITDNQFHENGAYGNLCKIERLEGSKTENLRKSNKCSGKSSCQLYPSSSYLIKNHLFYLLI